MIRILIVEDEITIARLIDLNLSACGYECTCEYDGLAAADLLEQMSFDLILLDIKLPGQSGFSLCSQIRAFSTVPIIFVTSCNTDMDELSSILLGGDAFITKPYHTAILLAKIAALLRRAYPDQPGQVLTYGGAELHLERSQLLYQGQAADLTKNELKILYYLFKHAGTICARGDLVSYLWDNQLYVDDNALSVNIGRIREKLSTLGLENFIKTKHRQGYTL